ncbi:MAG: response regulator transcription factor [Spirochaetales bacterium]|nr:response regulator transcription factor [Spirochaetales bacterium]
MSKKEELWRKYDIYLVMIFNRKRTCYTRDMTYKEIAVVDDEKHIRETISWALKKEGYSVSTYSDSREAFRTFESRLPDLIILDIIMPHIDGLELCRRIRQISGSTPIIFLSSKDEEFDRVFGLTLGADDYLCKPFSMRELIARIHVLFRRIELHTTPVSSKDLILIGPLELDTKRFTAKWKKTMLPLTVTEFRLLNSLAKNPGFVKTREQLLQEAYPHDTYLSDRTIDCHIKRIRKKIAEIDPASSEIETIYGLGYKFKEAAVG